jgi:hypothetical protein
MLWVAAECFSDRRTPSRQEIEEALAEAGINPAGLPVHVGRLIGLRGDVQHRGFEDLDVLRIAFYEMEAIVRVLIRRDMGTPAAGWWASHNAQAFSQPFDDVVDAQLGSPSTVWHADGLPPVEYPESQGIPRRVARPQDDPRVDLDPALQQETRTLIASAVVDVLEWHAPNATLAIRVGLPDGVLASSGITIGSDTIWIPEERLDGLSDDTRPDILVNFVWDLHAAVGAAIAQRAGIVSEGDGVIAVEAFGAWAQYLRLVRHGVFQASLLAMPPLTDPIALGKVTGWAAAGDSRAKAVVDGLPGPLGDLCRHIAAALAVCEQRRPLDLLW